MVLERFSKRTWFALWIFAVALVTVVGAYAYLLNKQKSVGFKTVVNGYALEIDKAVYKRGEKVTITFTNNNNETIVFPHCGWYIIRNSEGRQVAPGLVAQAELPVPPGESLTGTWYQTDFSSEVMVPPGIYTIELDTPTIPLAYLSLTFGIVD